MEKENEQKERRNEKEIIKILINKRKWKSKKMKEIK